ncbi:MAG: hypothetical protein HND48_24950 [Chloroflexi bacterium]|nr:hypothetical protein [Chloroflexota bacterium]
MLDDEAGVIAELRSYYAANGHALVEMTTPDYGRNAAAMQRISRASHIHIIAATGYNKGEVFRAVSRLRRCRNPRRALHRRGTARHGRHGRSRRRHQSLVHAEHDLAAGGKTVRSRRAGASPHRRADLNAHRGRHDGARTGRSAHPRRSRAGLYHHRPHRPQSGLRAAHRPR